MIPSCLDRKSQRAYIVTISNGRTHGKPPFIALHNEVAVAGVHSGQITDATRLDMDTITLPGRGQHPGSSVAQQTRSNDGETVCGVSSSRGN